MLRNYLVKNEMGANSLIEGTIKVWGQQKNEQTGGAMFQ